MSRGKYAFLAALLGLLPMLLPLSVDASVPILASVAMHFKTSTAATQFSLSAVVLGIALGQLVYGPMSDRLGRKPVILIGIGAYMVSAVACANAPSIEALISLRFFQGFFACSGVIVARAVIRDLFDREAGARLFALMMGIHGIMPAIAPGLSGWIEETFGWQAVFWAMAGFAFLTAAAVFFGLAETHPKSNRLSINTSTVISNYKRVMRGRSFLKYAICGAFMYGALMAYFAGAPVGLIQYLELSPIQVGIAMAVPMVSYIGAQLVVARITHRLGVDGLIRIGSIMAAASGGAILLFVMIDYVTVHSLIGPIILILISLAFIIPGTTAGAMSPFAEIAGAASSLLGFIQFLLAAAATVVIGLLNDATPLTMAAMICACTFLALFTYYIFVRPIHSRDRSHG